MNYAQAVNFIKQRRQNDLIRAEYAYSEALERFPSLKKADENYRAAVVRSLKSGGEGQAPDEKRALDEEIGRLGLQNTLFPAPHCSKCGDTGYCGGKICDCALSLSTSSDFISFPLHDFKDIDYSLFSQHDAARFRKAAGDFEIIFGEKFPDTKKRIFSLLGKSGTGKTFLASCAASAVVKKGYSAVFVTAFKFVSDAAKYHTTFDDTRDGFLQPYLDCDLMIIDDLGTEAVYKNITLEYLYLVINERQLAGKHTMITSNLSMDRLGERYGDRIASRLLDKKTCYAAQFDGDDIRGILGGAR